MNAGAKVMTNKPTAHNTRPIRTLGLAKAFLATAVTISVPEGNSTLFTKCQNIYYELVKGIIIHNE